MAKKDYIQFNNQLFEVDIRLVNQELDLRIPSGVIKDLLITDSIYSPFCHAVLSINSTGNSLDNLVIDQIDKARTGAQSLSYAFNTDSRDMFYISMVPKATTEGEFDRDIWGFNFNTELASPFVIYDEEEVVDSRGQLKTKVFYLKQTTEQFLEDSNIHWSTSQVVADQYANKINLSHATNSSREAYTGDCIKHLIQNSVPTYTPFAEDWDKGGTKIFYTSGPQSTAFNDLEHILDRHISTDTDDFCILGEERNGDMFLRSMANIYKKAYREDLGNLGDFFIDAFSTHCGTMDTAEKGDITKTVPSKVYGFTEKESNNLEGLVNFSYLNMANVDSMKQLVSTFTHNYSVSDKQFNIDCRDNHIYNIKQIFHKLYTSKMRGESVTTVLPINTVKVLNESVNHEFTGGGTKRERLHKGINRVLRQVFAFSPSVSFDIKGATSRRSGRFIIMNANYANAKSPFAKVFIGEWLTTNVTHYFSFAQSQYINTVSCVKPHANKPLASKEVDNMIDTLYNDLIQESNAS